MKSEELIKKHEGFRKVPYRDTEGILTVGYGRNLEKGLSNQVIDLLFAEDMIYVRRDCVRFEWFSGLSDVRQAVIENMIFNLGLTRFINFKKTISYLEAGDYKAAGIEMLDSKWAKQVGPRAIELSNMMITGVYNGSV